MILSAMGKPGKGLKLETIARAIMAEFGPLPEDGREGLGSGEDELSDDRSNIAGADDGSRTEGLNFSPGPRTVIKVWPYLKIPFLNHMREVFREKQVHEFLVHQVADFAHRRACLSMSLDMQGSHSQDVSRVPRCCAEFYISPRPSKAPL